MAAMSTARSVRSAESWAARIRRITHARLAIGFCFRVAIAPQIAGLHGTGGPLPGPWNRREPVDIQSDELSVPEATAGCGAGARSRARPRRRSAILLA